MTAQAVGKSRKSAVRPRSAAQSVAPFAPLSFAKRDPDAVEDRIVLFEIDGTEYTVPAVVPTGQALIYLANTSVMASEAQRGIYLVQVLAGADALNALLEQAEMTDGDWHKLITTLSGHAFGRLEAPGN